MDKIDMRNVGVFVLALSENELEYLKQILEEADVDWDSAEGPKIYEFAKDLLAKIREA